MNGRQTPSDSKSSSCLWQGEPKIKKNSTVRKVVKSRRKIVERGIINTPSTHIHDQTFLAWYRYLTRCVGTTWMSQPWILRRLANVSPFFNSLSNRLRITNYCLRSVSSSLLKFIRFIQGNNIAWTNLDMIRNLQHLHMNKKSYTYKILPFNSHWIFFWIKSVMWSE